MKNFLHPNGSEMVNNHFDNGSLFLCVKQSLVNGAHACLGIFGSTSYLVVNDHKENFWLLELDSHPTRFPQLGLMFDPRQL